MGWDMRLIATDKHGMPRGIFASFAFLWEEFKVYLKRPWEEVENCLFVGELDVDEIYQDRFMLELEVTDANFSWNELIRWLLINQGAGHKVWLVADC